MGVQHPSARIRAFMKQGAINDINKFLFWELFTCSQFGNSLSLTEEDDVEHGRLEAWMKLLNKELLAAFQKKHADAKKWIDNWVAHVEAPTTIWKVPEDIKAKYPSVSLVKGTNNVLIFNVKGNSYRLEVSVSYNNGVVFAAWAGTHTEYDKRNKDRKT